MLKQELKNLWKLEKRNELMNIVKQAKLKQYITDDELDELNYLYDEYDFKDDKEVKTEISEMFNTVIVY
jgi:hypothetical protein